MASNRPRGSQLNDIGFPRDTLQADSGRQAPFVQRQLLGTAVSSPLRTKTDLYSEFPEAVIELVIRTVY